MQPSERAKEILEKIEARGGIDTDNLPEIVIQLMRACESYKDMTGPEKKEVVTRACVLLIDASDVCGPFEGIVLSLVPMLCDAFIEVEKGKLRVRRPPIFNICCK